MDLDSPGSSKCWMWRGISIWTSRDLSEIALEVGEHLTETEIEELIEYDFDCANGTG
jgi:hypothetical protein